MGEAKSACDAKGVPLIGICPWGLVEGRQALWDEEADRRLLPMTEKNTVENFEAHEKQFCALKPPKIQSAPLNRQHTHFVFIDDGKEVLKSPFPHSCVCVCVSVYNILYVYTKMTRRRLQHLFAIVDENKVCVLPVEGC